MEENEDHEKRALPKRCKICKDFMEPRLYNKWVCWNPNCKEFENTKREMKK